MLQTPDSEIKRFLRVLFYIALGIILFDFAIGSGLRYLYDKQKSGLLYRTSYSIDSTRADYIVLGSSRANHDYDPKVFENILNTSFYNCGRDKQGLLYSCAVLSAILERYHPKGIIIDIRPDEFTQSDEGTLATLLPYHENKAISPYLDFNSHFEKVKLLSHIYPYNSLLTNLIVGLKKDWKEDYKGYRRLSNLNTDNNWETLAENHPADTIKIRAFSRLITRLDSLHIPVFLVISPIHYHYVGSVTTVVCDSLARQHPNLRFLNFTNRTDYSDNLLYSDNNHLNGDGATHFSTELASMIRPVFPKNY